MRFRTGRMPAGAPRMTTAQHRPSDVAKFAGRLWVAGQDAGLLELAGEELRVVKDTFAPHRLDVRENLLITAADVAAATSDGERFRGWPIAQAVDHILGGPSAGEARALPIQQRAKRARVRRGATRGDVLRPSSRPQGF